MSGNEIFPSLLWEGAGYDPQELEEEVDGSYKILRKMAQHVDSDEINGKSNKLEVIHFFSGRYPKAEVDEHIERARDALEDDE